MPTRMSTHTLTPDAALSALRLWQLISPALPVGAFAYSTGLEYAVHAGEVGGEAQAGEWIHGQLAGPLSRLDVPLLARFHRAWTQGDAGAVAHWSAFLHASRETAELRLEDRQLGMSLARVLETLGVPEASAWTEAADASFANLFALAGARWTVPLSELAAGYLWAWAENQVGAAVKLVPLGQSAGQRLLFAAGALIPSSVAEGLALADEDIGAGAFRAALASAAHETQYSRMFRS